MEREQAQELFSAYREGELDPAQVEAFEQLLDGDESTREEYEDFCRVLDTLSLMGDQPAPDNFMEKLQGRMRRRSGGRLFGADQWGNVTRVPYELFSLLLILIILAIYLLTLPVARVSSPSDNASRSGGDPAGQRE